MNKNVEFTVSVNGIAKTTSEFKELEKTLDQTGISADNLNQSLDQVAIDSLNGAKNVNELKKAIREATSVQLSGLLDEKRTAKISLAIGQAKDKVNDLREEAAALGGTRFEIFQNAISRIREGLFNLDWDKLKSGLSGVKTAFFGAEVGAKAFGTALKLAFGGGIVLAVGYLYENMDKVKNVLIKWIPGFKEMIENFIKWKNNIAEILGFVSDSDKNYEARADRISKLVKKYNELTEERLKLENKIKGILNPKEWDVVGILAMEVNKRLIPGIQEQIDKINEEIKPIEIEIKTLSPRGASSDFEDPKKYRKMRDKEAADSIAKAKAADLAEQKRIEDFNVKYNYSLTAKAAMEKEAQDAKDELKWQDVVSTEETEQAKTNAVIDGNIKRIESDRNTYIAKKEIAVAEFGLAVQAGQLIQTLAGKSKEWAIAGIVIEKAGSLGQIVANTAIANAKSVAASPLTAGQPWVAINTASGFLSGLQVVAAAAKSISEINSSVTSTSGGDTQAVYANGGLLKGPRHANGGILTPFGELEGGEYVLNRRSTMAFLPLLDRLNKFGMENPSPQTLNNDIKNQPMLIKTYVVSSDITNKQEMDMRLKRIARL